MLGWGCACRCDEQFSHVPGLQLNCRRALDAATVPSAGANCLPAASATLHLTKFEAKHLTTPTYRPL